MPRGRQKLPLPIFPGGVREDINPAAIPDGGLLDSENWLTRQGIGRPRPGYVLVGSQLAAADRTMGFGFRGSVGTETAVVVHTLTTAYSWDGLGTFTAITGTWTASTETQHVRMAAYMSGGTLWLVRTNIRNALDKWNGTGSFSDVGGSPPRATDITVLAGHILLFHTNDGTTDYPYRAQWNDFNDIDVWTSTNTAELDATPDEGIACRAFGPLSAGVYKEDSVWLAVAQAARAPFQFQLVERVPGPVSPAALITYRGKHHWLAKDGVVYAFDGSRVQEAGRALATTIRTNFDWAQRAQTHGHALATSEPELWWYYPVIGTTIRRPVSLNITTGAMNPHLFADNMSASSEWVAQATLAWNDLTGTWNTLSATYATWDAMGSEFIATAILGDRVGKVYQMGIPANDNGTAIAWDFTHGWKAPAGLGQRLFVDGVVSYWKKTTPALTVTVGLTVTDSLGDADTEATSTFDVSTDSNHLVNFVNTRGQWARVKHSATSALSGLEHRGAALLGWIRGMA